MSSVTDPYQPLEREIRLVRNLLEIFLEKRHKPKLVIQTRSPLAVRDVDLFREIEEMGGKVQVNMTVTTDDEEVRRAFEPACPSNAARLRAIGKIAQKGVTACITMTPLLLVSDPEGFVNSLLRTGIKKFIVQPFHFKKGKFVAQTREQAAAIVADKLGCSRGEYQEHYMRSYRKILQVLRERLPQLGEGKDGFKPPWRADLAAPLVAPETGGPGRAGAGRRG